MATGYLKLGNMPLPLQGAPPQRSETVRHPDAGTSDSEAPTAALPECLATGFLKGASTDRSAPSPPFEPKAASSSEGTPPPRFPNGNVLTSPGTVSETKNRSRFIYGCPLWRLGDPSGGRVEIVSK